MKGLLLKDWYVTWKYCKLHLGIILLMSLLSLIRPVGSLYLSYVMLFAGMIPIYTLSVDEKWGWNGYAQTMPYTRRDVVTGKYLFALLVIGAAALLQLLLWGGRSLFFGGSGGEVLTTFCFLLSFALVFPALTLPFMYRWGVEKGRFVMLAVVALAVGIVFALQAAPEGVDLTSPAALPAAAGPLLLAGMLALLFLSRLLAVKLYEKREL